MFGREFESPQLHIIQTMDLTIIAIVALVYLLSYVGAFHPAIPGPLIAFGAYWLMSFHSQVDIAGSTLLTVACITILVFVIDFTMPAYISKRLGGSKASNRGALIGTVIGALFMPLGFVSLFLGPMIGAFVGEMTQKNADTNHAIKIAFGAFLGFVTGTGLKLIFAFVLTFMSFSSLF